MVPLQQYRASRSEILLLTVALICTSCTRFRDPRAAFAHAQSTLEHGDIAAAAKEAEKGYLKFHSISPEWAWTFTILRARVLHWQGRNDEALALLASEPAAPTSGELAVKRQRLEAAAYISLHRFGDGEKKLKEAEEICAVSPYPSCSDVLSSRAILEMERGEYAKAQVIFERVLAASRANGDQFLEANTLLDLSWSADEQTHFDEALDWASAARKMALSLEFADVAQQAVGNMGWAYYKLGDTEKAEKLFIESLEQARASGNLTDVIRWLTTTAYISMDAGDLQAADNSLEDALTLSRRINSRGDIINSLIALAFVSEQTGKLDDARRYAGEALRMAREDGNKRDEVYPRLVQGRITAKQHDAATAETAFREVAASPDAPVFLKWQAEHSLAHLYEDENQPDAADREYRTALSTFEGARANLRKMDSRLPFLTNATAIYDDYIHFLIARGKKDEALQVADFSRARTLGEGLGLLPQGTSFKPYPLNATEIARRAGGTILFYWLGEKQSYLWAIAAQKVSLFTLPPKAEIEAEVQRYRKTLTGPEDTLEASETDGAALYRMLVEPAEQLLNTEDTHVSQRRRDVGHPVYPVFIIPDGSLNGLNFETLLVPGTPPHYWIEDATIANANSLRLLASSRNRKRVAGGNLLLLGDAAMANPEYPPLPKAAQEMQSIQKHFGRAQEQVFAGEQATPPAYLKSKPEQFSFIHFVAHGTASRSSPLESAIVLSKAISADDSFKLYARDIVQHPLHADLVTISACYGAGSRAYSGEGLVGLSWAFLGAGAHNVIGALWEVSDVSTPQLMDQLYDEMKKGRSPAAALRSAKLSLLHSNSAFRKPFYWAPFQLYAGS